MQKVLWLCSWYPNKVYPYEGDFVQRHAQAAALYAEIHVIKLTPDPDGSGVLNEIKTDPQFPNLTEQRIYYPKKPGWWGRLTAYSAWYRLYKKAIQQYIHQQGGRPDLVHVHIPFNAGVMGQWVKKTYGVPYVVTEHWGGYNTIVANNYHQRPIWFKKIIRNTFLNAAGVHSVSDYLGKEINKLGISVDYRVLPNVVQTPLFYYRKKKITTPFRCLHISAGAPMKNVSGILEAFQQLPQTEFSLTVVGLPDALNTAYQKTYPAVGFAGIQPYDEIAEAYREADVLIIFSDSENAPCVIAEAFCCGTPVIATDVGGIPELVDSSNSILITPRDQAGLIEAIRKMKRQYARFAFEKTAHNAAQIFSYENVGKKMVEWYMECIKKSI